jgi:hypothetical protein
MIASGASNAQIRAFDNSRSLMPWLYNPAATFIKDFQAYVGYDGRGNSGVTPQSLVAGIRMPTQHGRRYAHKNPATMIGIQFLNTTQDLLSQSTMSASFAHQVNLSPDMRLAVGIGAGIYNMKYAINELVYLDQNDPLLANGGSFFNMHLNAGVSFVYMDKLKINLAAPYLLKDHRANIGEIIFRASYPFEFNPDFKLIVAANFDTYNKNTIVGGDVKAEFKKVFSLLAGGDNYKFFGGLEIDVKHFSLGYTYGQNFSTELDRLVAHQISIFSAIPFQN